MKPIAIITARGGSKRIPRKNIKKFIGKPIIAYSIQACLDSGLFSQVIVSTDDAEIAKISKKYGAEVPFMSSKKNSDDHAGTEEVVMEVLTKLNQSNNGSDRYCVIYPTAPMLSKELLKRTYKEFVQKNSDALFTIAKFDYPVQRSLKLKNNLISFWMPKHEKSRSQDLQPHYHDVGQLYWIKTASFLKQKKLFMKKTFGHVIPGELVQDIDTPEDWKAAELKMKILKSRI